MKVNKIIIAIGFSFILLGLILAWPFFITGNIIKENSNIQVKFSFILIVLGIGLIVIEYRQAYLPSDLESLASNQSTNFTYEEMSQKAYQRYIEIKRFLERNKDQEGLSQLQEVVRDAREYIDTSRRWENFQNSKLNLMLGGTAFQIKRYEMEVKRSTIHIKLIDDLTKANRYLSKKYGDKIPTGGIYSLPPPTINDRTAVTEWATYLNHGLANIS